MVLSSSPVFRFTNIIDWAFVALADKRYVLDLCRASELRESFNGLTVKDILGFRHRLIHRLLGSMVKVVVNKLLVIVLCVGVFNVSLVFQSIHFPGKCYPDPYLWHNLQGKKVPRLLIELFCPRVTSKRRPSESLL